MPQTIRFVDLRSQYADLEPQILEAIAGTLRTGVFVGGEAVTRFESSLAAFCGAKHAVGCSDGTLALVLGLRAAGLREGDGVIVPANSFIASANAVVHAGGIPVLVDCDPRTYLIDLDRAEEALRKGKAAFIMPVHLYGNPCPMEDVLRLARRHGARVIEDNAQAIGASVGGKRTGSFGVCAGISFYPAKNLGAFGQGGAILTDDDQVATTARMLGDQGQAGRKYYHDAVGYNARLDSMQASILSLLLGRVESFNASRRRVADEYARHLPAERLQVRTAGGVHVYHLFEYRCGSLACRERVAKALRAADIQFGYHYPVPIHKQKAYGRFNGESLPVVESLADTLISLPMHPHLHTDDIERVCAVVMQADEEER